MTCERCGQRPGIGYAFTYGSKVGQEHVVGGIKHTWRRGGGMEVVICNTCIRKRRLSMALPAAAGANVFAGLCMLAYYNPDFGPGEPDRELFWITLVGSVLCLIAFAATLRSTVKTRGENLAIDTKLPQLKLQGWDTFWRSDGSMRLITWVPPWRYFRQTGT